MNGQPARRPQPPLGNLTAVLTFVALGDLLMSHVARPGLSEATGNFLHHLAGVLGVWLFVLGFVGVLRRQELFPRTMRVTACVFALFFVALAVPGIAAGTLPDRMFVHLRISHAFLAWIVALACWRTFTPVRARLAVTLFALPCLLQAAAVFGAQLGWTPRGQGALSLFRIAEFAALGAGAASPLLLRPRTLSRGLRWGSQLLGALAACALMVALFLQFDLMQFLLVTALHLDIPSLHSGEGAAYAALLVVATGAVTTTVLRCLSSGGAARLVGYSLVLLALAGHPVATVAQVVLSGCGLLALALGVSRAGAGDTAFVAPTERPLARL